MATRMTPTDLQLWYATYDGDITGMRTALSNGADINWCNPRVGNRTPLHAAASRNRIDAVKWLIENGAGTECRGVDGWTPLILAAGMGHSQVVTMLLEKGADITASTNNSKTALVLAEQEGKAEVASLLRIHSGKEKQAALSALEKGMEEGFLILNNTKITICGPPAVGKTAFNDLLFNRPPPLKHHSTPIACRPIQAIQRISAEGQIWEKVTEQDLLATLSDAILTIEEPTKDTNTRATASHSNTGLESPPFEEQTDSPPSGGAQSLPDDTTPPPHKPSTTSDTAYYSNKIIKHLQESKRRQSKHYEANWIHLLDSGGQPQFSDMLRLFNRGNSLYIIVMKATESLHDKPTFTYSINGKPLSTPKDMTMTNLQMIERFVRSIAASKNCVLKIGGKSITSRPAFVIVVTHCDKSKFKRALGLEETLKEKNAELQSCLSEFLDLFIFYNRDSNELVFPVNNLCEKNREKISADIRERIMSQSKSISFSVPIPIRWYMFEIKMNEEASVRNKGMISLESCYTIGVKLGMSQSDVDQCLVYLDSLTLCIYYSSILHHVVFTNPQFLVDCLSDIVRVSFVDDIQQLLPDGVSLSPDTQLELKRDGVFDESLLDSLGLTFIPDLFSKSDLLSLLKHLLLVSPIISSTGPTRYFLPIVLPPENITKKQKKAFTKTCDPLVLSFNSKLVLQGLFPTLIVSLLSREESPHFFIDSKSPFFPQQLRHAVKLYSEDLFGSVIFVDEHNFIEVYFTGNPKDCSVLRSVILEGLSASAAALAYNEETLGISAVTYCHQKHRSRETERNPHPIRISFKRDPPEISCSIETDLPPIALTDERQSCWLLDPVAPSVVPIGNILPEGSVLNESQAPVILKAINKIVNEWETLGLYLGIENEELKLIHSKSFYQIDVSRKDMIVHWLKTGTATREKLKEALEDLKRNDVAAEVKRLPKQ